MIIRIGLGSCGIAAGGLKVWDAIQKVLDEQAMDIQMKKTGCAGMCHYEPLMDVLHDGRQYSYVNLNPAAAAEIVSSLGEGHLPENKYLLSIKDIDKDIDSDLFSGQVRIALRNCGRIDPEAIEDYIDSGGYQSLRRVLLDMTAAECLEEIKTSGLRGRGGAGFPTWFKWKATRDAIDDIKYVVCNADEGDPGAFMDRSLLEGDPHSIIEGLAIAGYAIGAGQGIIYVRAEYPLAVKRLELAIEQARQKSYLGNNIFGSDFSFDLQIKKGAGAFVCGEETALLASLQGERGMPHLKPPFPSEHGYWGHPTSINNVETLANIPWIIQNGGQAFAAVGSDQSKGTKVFALAGKIKYGGLVEVPMGMPLRDIIYDLGGGIRGDGAFKAVQLGGPSGGCIPASLLDTPVDYESITSTGAIMGSGGMVVMDESSCMVDLARFFLDFTQKESCGKCVQCRLGTKRMLEILERICAGQGRKGDIERLESIALHVKESSLCGLGQSAPNPVLTTLKYFRDEYEAHIYEQTCPAHQCKALIHYTIDPEKCKGCGLCARACPVECISGERKKPFVIDQSRCTRCGTCVDICPDKWNAVQVD